MTLEAPLLPTENQGKYIYFLLADIIWINDKILYPQCDTFDENKHMVIELY